MVKLDVSHYSGKYIDLNLVNKLDVTQIDLARAFITMGNKNWSTSLGMGFFRISEMISKVFAYTEIIDGNLIMKDVFSRLNSSEKTSISYYMGQGLTKLYAEKYLKVKWLCHLDDYAPMTGFYANGAAIPKISLGTSKKVASRPDYIGIEKANVVHILESKGRSSSYSKDVMQHAINQVSQVISYNGISPETRTACFFDISQKPIRGRIIDPDFDGRGIDFELDEVEVIKKYYSNIFESDLKYSERKIGEYTYKVALVCLPNVYFGFDTRILDLNFSSLLEKDLYSEIYLSEFNNVLRSLGTDGIIIFKDEITAI